MVKKNKEKKMVKIFIPQEISKVAYEKLKTIGDVTMYTGTDGPMPHDEILKEVTDKDSRQIYIDHLNELHDRASLLATEPALHPIQLGGLNHIISRPVGHHVTLTKSSDNNNLITTF